ncbi:MAG TPA: hypothetical protein VJR30_16310 [Bradyrhizobium sp.]|nr:hypothetical protein [Bradyrhizobium sp.]
MAAVLVLRAVFLLAARRDPFAAGFRADFADLRALFFAGLRVVALVALFAVRFAARFVRRGRALATGGTINGSATSPSAASGT